MPDPIELGYLDGLLGVSPSGLTSSETRHVAAQTLLALDAMHQKQVVYLALHPSSILMMQGEERGSLGSVRLSDTQHVHRPAAGAAAKERHANLMGYVAPELLAGDSCSAAADIWSFGCLLVHMITGRPLFLDNDVGTVLTSILKHIGQPTRRLASIMQGHADLIAVLQDALPNCPAKSEDSSLGKRFRVILGNDFPMLQLLLSCLNISPGNRPTAAQLLMHPAMTGHVPSGRKPLHAEHDATSASTSSSQPPSDSFSCESSAEDLPSHGRDGAAKPHTAAAAAAAPVRHVYQEGTCCGLPGCPEPQFSPDSSGGSSPAVASGGRGSSLAVVGGGGSSCGPGRCSPHDPQLVGDADWASASQQEATTVGGNGPRGSCGPAQQGAVLPSHQHGYVLPAPRQGLTGQAAQPVSHPHFDSTSAALPPKPSVPRCSPIGMPEKRLLRFEATDPVASNAIGPGPLIMEPRVRSWPMRLAQQPLQAPQPPLSPGLRQTHAAAASAAGELPRSSLSAPALQLKSSMKPMAPTPPPFAVRPRSWCSSDGAVDPRGAFLASMPSGASTPASDRSRSYLRPQCHSAGAASGRLLPNEQCSLLLASVPRRVSASNAETAERQRLGLGSPGGCPSTSPRPPQPPRLHAGASDAPRRQNIAPSEAASARSPILQHLEEILRGGGGDDNGRRDASQALARAQLSGTDRRDSSPARLQTPAQAMSDAGRQSSSPGRILLQQQSLLPAGRPDGYGTQELLPALLPHRPSLGLLMPVAPSLRSRSREKARGTKLVYEPKPPPGHPTHAHAFPAPSAATAAAAGTHDAAFQPRRYSAMEHDDDDPVTAYYKRRVSDLTLSPTLSPPPGMGDPSTRVLRLTASSISQRHRG